MYKRAPNMGLRRLSILAFCLVSMLSMSAAAQNDEIKIPNDVRPFIQKGLIAIALEDRGSKRGRTKGPYSRC
jgi:hypothetical protein